MAPITYKSSARFELTSYSGLALVGECFAAAQVEALLDRHIPVSQGMRSSDLIKSMTALLCLGKSDFEAIEPFRTDRFFKEALGIHKVPSSVWMRQRLDQKANDFLAHIDELSLRLIERSQAPISPHLGYVCLDIDTFVMNNDNSQKELVSRTYQGVDGYTPIAAYVGNEGWNLGLALRKGSDHSSRNAPAFFTRMIQQSHRLIQSTQPILLRADSAFDGREILLLCTQAKEQLAQQSQDLDFIIKWNPREQDRQAFLQDSIAGGMTQIREGKRIGWVEHLLEKEHQGEKRKIRLVVRVTERTSDKKGQMLIEPEISLDGWYTSLNDSGEDIAKLYRYHGTHEQYHSEIKSDLDVERLPSGKFATNDLIVHLAGFAYNCLRLIGQLGLAGNISPVRHPAKRRRIKTVLQEIIYRAAKVIQQARGWVLDFGRGAQSIVNIFTHVTQNIRCACRI